MASISKRGNRWTAQVRRKGIPSRSKTFATRSEAKAWASVEEAKFETGDLIQDRHMLRSTTLGAILLRYELEVTPRKRGEESERLRLAKMRRDPIASVSLLNLTPSRLATYRDRRLEVAKPATVHRELALVSHVLDVARRDWGIVMAANPVCQIRKPSPGAARDRRIGPGEYERLKAAAKDTRNPDVVLAIELAIETGMRRGELLALEWKHIDLASRIAHIPITKTGVPRTIPLTLKAVELLAERTVKEGIVLPVTGNALRLSWTRITKRAGVADLRFHDLRHEAISRFFELGLSLPEVALISGHRDPRMLLRYTQLRATDLVEKLARRPWDDDPRRRAL